MSNQPTQTPAERWKGYVDGLAWQKGSLDESSYLAFLRGGSLQIPSGEAVDYVSGKIHDAGDTPKASKLQSQARRAYEHAEAEDSFEPRHRGANYKKPEYEPTKLKDFAGNWPSVVDACWLGNRSVFDPAEMLKPETFLDFLYAKGERVLVFHQFKSQGQYLRIIGEGNRALSPSPGTGERECGDLPTFGGKAGVWFLAQPVDGEWHPNPRHEGKPSRRSEEACTAWRYMVLESDEAPARAWVGALVQLPLRIEAIYTSGGKSIHALVRVDCTTKAEWDELRARAIKSLVPMGADAGSITAVRLTRLPFCSRGNAWQRLLYINPGASAVPMVKIAPRRDAEAVWCKHGETVAGMAGVDADELAFVKRGLSHYAQRNEKCKAAFKQLAP